MAKFRAGQKVVFTKETKEDWESVDWCKCAGLVLGNTYTVSSNSKMESAIGLEEDQIQLLFAIERFTPLEEYMQRVKVTGFKTGTPPAIDVKIDVQAALEERKQELEKKNVHELRKLARINGFRGAKILIMPKHMLLELLQTGQMPTALQNLNAKPPTRHVSRKFHLDEEDDE